MVDMNQWVWCNSKLSLKGAIEIKCRYLISRLGPNRGASKVHRLWDGQLLHTELTSWYPRGAAIIRLTPALFTV